MKEAAQSQPFRLQSSSSITHGCSLINNFFADSVILILFLPVTALFHEKGLILNKIFQRPNNVKKSGGVLNLVAVYFAVTCRLLRRSTTTDGGYRLKRWLWKRKKQEVEEEVVVEKKKKVVEVEVVVEKKKKEVEEEVVVVEKKKEEVVVVVEKKEEELEEKKKEDYHIHIHYHYHNLLHRRHLRPIKNRNQSSVGNKRKKTACPAPEEQKVNCTKVNGSQVTDERKVNCTQVNGSQVTDERKVNCTQFNGSQGTEEREVNCTQVNGNQYGALCEPAPPVPESYSTQSNPRTILRVDATAPPASPQQQTESQTPRSSKIQLPPSPPPLPPPQRRKEREERRINIQSKKVKKGESGRYRFPDTPAVLQPRPSKISSSTPQIVSPPPPPHPVLPPSYLTNNEKKVNLQPAPPPPVTSSVQQTFENSTRIKKKKSDGGLTPPLRTTNETNCYPKRVIYLDIIGNQSPFNGIPAPPAPPFPIRGMKFSARGDHVKIQSSSSDSVDDPPSTFRYYSSLHSNSIGSDTSSSSYPNYTNYETTAYPPPSPPELYTVMSRPCEPTPTFLKSRLGE